MIEKRNNKVGSACGTDREKKNKYRIFVGKLEGKRPLGRPGPRWVKIKIDIGRWIGFIWHRIWAGDGLLWGVKILNTRVT